MGGGGEAFDPTLRSWSGEWPTIKKGYKGQEKQFWQFGQKDPLLGAAIPFARSGLEAVSPWTQSILASQGKLTPAQQTAAEQEIQTGAAQTGMGHSPANLFNRALNRLNYMRQNVGYAMGVRGQALQPVLSTSETAQKVFSGLTNPMLNYIGQIFDFNANAQNAASIAGANKQAGTSGGIMSTVGSLASAIGPMLAMSDKSLKAKIRGTGAKTVEGIPIRTFEYKRAPGRRILGLVADEVLKKRPDAVVRVGEKLAVDYRRLLGAPFMEVEAA
jgi:hypothetical protein